MTNTIGFIILRHVTNRKTNKYWQRCYDCIREFYPENVILIIDDSSDYEYISNKKMYKTLIINSEYEKRGELLPYYYYLQHKLFDTAVILHDSTFIQKYIDFRVDKYKLIWEFDHYWDHVEDERHMLSLFNDNSLLEFHANIDLWKGCFGGMCIITHDFLSQVNSKYNISLLLNHITSRHNRSSFERVIACLLQKEYKKEVLLGNIHSYFISIEENKIYGFGEYVFDEIENECYRRFDILKIWTGR
jgi:hypothetical protein